MTEQRLETEHALCEAVELFFASNIGMELTMNNIKNYQINEDQFDLALIINVREGCQTYKYNYKPGIYLFDVVDLPLEIRSPEFINVILNKCFEKDENDNLVLKSEYERKRYLAPESNPLLDRKLCVPLSDELIKVCIRHYKYNGKSNYHYGVLGTKAFESLSERIDNKLGTGRCDRVYSTYGATGPCMEDTALKIMKENGKSSKTKLKTARVYSGKGIWKRVIVD